MQFPKRTEDELRGFAQHVLENNIDQTAALSTLHPDQRDYFKEIYKETRRPQGLGEVWARKGEIPANFVQSWGEMTMAVGELLLVQAPVGLMKGAVQSIGSKIPGEWGDPYREKNNEQWQVARALTNQLLKELMAQDSAEMKELESLLESTDDPAMQASMRARLAQMRAELKPLTTAFAEIGGEAFGYLIPGHEQSFMEMVVYEPAVVVSDLAGIASMVLTGGQTAAPYLSATKAARIAPHISRIQRILDFVDPASLPGSAVTGAVGKMTEPGSRMMRAPEADLSDDKIREIGRKYGIEDPMDMPTSQYNPHERFTTDEQIALEQPGKVGDRALGRIEGSYDAGVGEAGRLQNEMNEVGASLDAQHAGARALEALDETKTTTRLEANPLYQPLKEHGDTTFDAEFGLEEKLQGLIDELKGSGEAVDPDARQAANILEAELNHMRQRQAEAIKKASGDPDKVVPNDELTAINEMSLQSLRRLRTTFREKYRNAFLATDANKVTRIGEHSHEAKVYGRISGILDEAIDNLESGGKIAEGSGESIKAGDKVWRDRAQLEGTVGGQLLFKNKNNPIGLIDGILSDKKITSKEIQNIYELLGEEGTKDLQAGLLHRLFETTGLNEEAVRAANTVKQRPAPGKLGDALTKLESGRSGFVEDVFGAETASDLRDLATFMDGLEPSFGILRGSQTRKANIRLKQGSIASAVGLAIGSGVEVFQAAMYTGSAGLSDGAIIGGAAAVIGYLAKQGVEVWKFSETQRRRLAEGLELSPRQRKLVDTAIEWTRQKYVKPVEVGARVKDKAKDKSDEEPN